MGNILTYFVLQPLLEIAVCTGVPSVRYARSNKATETEESQSALFSNTIAKIGTFFQMYTICVLYTVSFAAMAGWAHEMLFLPSFSNKTSQSFSFVKSFQFSRFLHSLPILVALTFSEKTSSSRANLCRNLHSERFFLVLYETRFASKLSPYCGGT